MAWLNPRGTYREQVSKLVCNCKHICTCLARSPAHVASDMVIHGAARGINNARHCFSYPMHVIVGEPQGWAVRVVLKILLCIRHCGNHGTFGRPVLCTHITTQERTLRTRERTLRSSCSDSEMQLY